MGYTTSPWPREFPTVNLAFADIVIPFIGCTVEARDFVRRPTADCDEAVAIASVDAYARRKRAKNSLEAAPKSASQRNFGTLQSSQRSTLTSSRHATPLGMTMSTTKCRRMRVSPDLKTTPVAMHFSGTVAPVDAGNLGEE